MEKKKKIIRMPEDLIALVNLLAKSEGKSFSQEARDLMDAGAALKYEEVKLIIDRRRKELQERFK